MYTHSTETFVIFRYAEKSKKRNCFHQRKCFNFRKYDLRPSKGPFRCKRYFHEQSRTNRIRVFYDFYNVFLSRGPFAQCTIEKLPVIPVIGLYNSVNGRVRKTDHSDSDGTSLFFPAGSVALETARSSHDKCVSLRRWIFSTVKTERRTANFSEWQTYQRYENIRILSEQNSAGDDDRIGGAPVFLQNPTSGHALYRWWSSIIAFDAPYDCNSETERFCSPKPIRIYN